MAVAVLTAAAGLLVIGGTGGTAAEPTPSEFHVQADRGWQATEFTLEAVNGFQVIFRSGSWTVDHRNFPWVGPDGYDAATDAQIFQGCKVLAHEPYGRLLARVGGGQPLVVGANGMFRAGSNGRLEFRINDECLGDNAGFVTITVIPFYCIYDPIQGGCGWGGGTATARPWVGGGATRT